MRKYKIITILWLDSSKTILISIKSFVHAIKCLMELVFSSFIINHDILFNKGSSFLLKVKINIIFKVLKIVKLWTLAYIKPYALSECISS